jgi:hypothetical protein
MVRIVQESTFQGWARQRRPSELPSYLRVLRNQAVASLLAKLETKDIFSTW